MSECVSGSAVEFVSGFVAQWFRISMGQRVSGSVGPCFRIRMD